MAGMTPKQLRDVAWALDHLTRVAEAVLEPLARADALNAGRVEVAFDLTKANGVPMTPADAQILLDWLAGDDMQRDLRAWADDMEHTS